MGLRVIGAGFGRTGTDSMRTALDMLGFGPTHHMRVLRDRPELYRLWLDLAEGAAPDWEALFDGYRSCMDWPAAFFWRELAAAYPEALVVLTWRTPASWWTSFESTILPVVTDPASDAPVAKWLADAVFAGRPDDRAAAIRIYERHVEEVIATIPRERLLVHRLGDGWQPLCARLGVPVPDMAYPSRNTASEFRERQSGS